ncbi:uncharacterized protein DFL_005484 [Arthrobotrys flagrans]|uniref:Uncharacterized protein n=1 Tax=Arthrobotrys flagrans TaxID=97331 RepID=A0A436ZY91_ARTFL|nr:hypothetical protein DFL_005484 [Arthrobotrys flagrans]
MSILTIAGLSSFYSRLDGRTDIDQLCDEAVGRYVLSRPSSDITGTTDRDGLGSFKELLETVGSVLLFQLIHQFRQPTGVIATPESQDPSYITPRLYSLSPDKIPSILRFLHQQYRSFYFSVSGFRRIVLETLYIGSRLLHLEGVQARRQSQWFEYLADAIDDPTTVSSDDSVGATISFGIKVFLLRRPEQGSSQRTRDLRYCAGVPSGLISNPLNPLDFRRVRTVIIELQQQSGTTVDQINDIDYFWSMCDILFVIIAASAEPYHDRNIDDYTGRLSSLGIECQTNITNTACDNLDYIASLADEASRAQGTEGTPAQ